MALVKYVVLACLILFLPYSCVTAAQDKGKEASSSSPAELHKQSDNTDIFAIPLDSSEKEEESQVKDLEKNMAQPQQKTSVKS